MTIALVMIVRNEAVALPRLLQSLRGKIDSAVIVDTGSTDGTQLIARHELGMHGIPHRILEHDWIDFGTNRGMALEAARGEADWLLLADADFEFSGDFELGADRDAYQLTITEGTMDYAYPALLRGDLEWSYIGVTHEHLDTSGRTVGRLEQPRIMHHCDGGSRDEKFVRDLHLLLPAVSEDPSNERNVFYLAQTLACLGRDADAARFYKARVELGGWDEEVYYSLYKAGVLENEIALLLRAHTLRPTRLEALYEAAHRLRDRGAHSAIALLLAPYVKEPVPDDVLFVEPWVWKFGLRFELALALQNTGQTHAAMQQYEHLLHVDLPPAYLDAVRSNMDALAGHTLSA